MPASLSVRSVSVRRRRVGRVVSTLFLAIALATAVAETRAAVGLDEIASGADAGPVTLYYPTDAVPKPVRRGQFVLDVALGAAPTRGNGHLVVVSHGSGGSPWVQADVARALVAAGFVVAMPEHRADNYRDPSDPGPDSWTMRPKEVAQAIDAVARDPRFAALLDFDHVGLYGMSAGGHTALSLAGGRWSPAAFARHCEAHIAEDFPTCVGLITRLTGSVFDVLRKSVAVAVIRHRFGADDTVRADADPRIAAIVAGVPAAADFDAASLARPRLPLGFITARGDRWLAPRFHSERILAACSGCERLHEVEGGGHGALLSPLPPAMTGLVGDLLNDPPGFDRVATTTAVDAAIVDFFRRHLLATAR